MKDERNKKRLADIKEELDNLQRRIDLYRNDEATNVTNRSTENIKKIFGEYIEKLSNKNKSKQSSKRTV